MSAILPNDENAPPPSLENFEQFENLFKHANDAILIFEPETETVLEVNDKACEIYGRRRADFVGRSLKTMSQNVSRGEDELRKLLRDGVYDQFESVHLRGDGTPFYLTINAVVIEYRGAPAVLTINRDITERQVARESLEKSERQYRMLADGIMHQVWTAQPDGAIDYVNRRTVEYFGAGVEVTDSSHWRRIVHPDDLPPCVRRWRRALRTGAPFEIEFRLLGADGAYRWHLARATPGRNARGEIIKWFGTNTDIDRQKYAETELQKNIALLTSTFEATADGILAVNADNEIEIFNRNFARMWNLPPAALDDLPNAEAPLAVLEQIKNPAEFLETNRRIDVRGNDVYADELELKDGRIYERHSRPQILNGAVVGRVFNFRDVTTRRQAERQLFHDAFHDSLTGLANRALFMDHLRLTMERGKSRRSDSYAVLFLDFDRFKLVNDSLGHQEGDKLLQQIARRIESATRAGDLAARLGGDEFVLLLSEMLSAADAVQIAERIQRALEKPFDVGGQEIYISASIGIAPGGAGYASADDLLRDADTAMYRAKARGRARYEIFDRRMHEQASQQLSLENGLRRALERGEFVIYYQPIMNLETARLAGFEALVRWQHPERGVVSPLEFIGAAEDSNLILPLGAWILRESCRQMRAWQERTPAAAADLTVSVNLSSKQFAQFDLAEQIKTTLDATRLDPRCLKLEITESHVMENSEQAMALMNRLRALGIEFSLDDFGTGYSSLSYLHRLSAGCLKIDRSFVKRMTESDEPREIVSTIIKLAQNLKMKVVAEGIETHAQLARLRNLKCEFGQGYLFAAPLPPDEAAQFIEDDLKSAPVSIERSFVENRFEM